MPIDRVVILASSPTTVARLPAQFAKAGLTVDAWSPYGSRLAYCKSVHKHFELHRDPNRRADQWVQIAKSVSERDWIIVGTDEDLYEISDLAKHDPTVLRLLPFNRHSGACASKIAMAATLDTLGVRQPVWQIATSIEELEKAVAAVGGHAMVKSARGGGGQQITEARTGSTSTARGKAPFLVQAFAVGEAMSIELFVARGRVVLAPYSRMLLLDSDWGMSCARQYERLEGGGLLRNLELLATELGGTWLANITAIRLTNGQHTIVEVDPRPNVWHAYAERLGLPTKPIWQALNNGSRVPAYATAQEGSRRVFNVTRTVKRALKRDPRSLLNLASPDAWRYMHHGDIRFTIREARDLARWFILTRAGRRPTQRASSM